MAQTRDPLDSEYTSDWPIVNEQRRREERPTRQERREHELDEEPNVKEWLPSSPRSSDPDPRERYVVGESEIMADGQIGGRELTNGPEDSNPEGSLDINNRQYWERSNGFR